MFTVFTIITIGILSPGPAFFFVGNSAISNGRGAGIWTALGIAIANVTLATVLLSGATSFFRLNYNSIIMLQLVALTYIFTSSLVLFVKSVRAPPVSTVVPRVRLSTRSKASHKIFAGSLFQIMNPKTWLFFGSAFSSNVGSQNSAQTLTGILLSIFVVSTAWYTIVAYVASLSSVALHTRVLSIVSSAILSTVTLTLISSVVLRLLQ